MKEQQLQELSIYFLRELARRSGVSSPTSKRKEQLISEIVAITEGKQQPILSSKHGRPPKSFAYEIPNSMIFNGKEASKSYQFCQPETEFTSKEMQSIYGYVQISNNVAFMLVQNSALHFVKCLIPATFLCNFKLKNGDKLIAEIEWDAAQPVVKEIFNINGFPILNLPNKPAYETISHIMPFKKVEFANNQLNAFNIMFGENVYIYGKNNNQNTMSIIEYLNCCSADVKIYINVSVAEKNKIYIKELKQAELFVSNFTETTEYAKEVVAIAIERAKRAMESGNNVMVAVDDIQTLISLEPDEFSLTKNLISLTKASKKGSISIVAINTSENVIFVEKLADKRLILDNKVFNLI